MISENQIKCVSDMWNYIFLPKKIMIVFYGEFNLVAQFELHHLSLQRIYANIMTKVLERLAVYFDK